eukprot:13994396-Alexandrium_andersonii.AAC.1
MPPRRPPRPPASEGPLPRAGDCGGGGPSRQGVAPQLRPRCPHRAAGVGHVHMDTWATSRPCGRAQAPRARACLPRRRRPP